jgi:DNA-binding HxlR family transcriptional regulator
MRGSSVTRAIRVIGDRWSILVIRDAFQGVRRFEDLIERTGASRSTLSRRLCTLVASGVLRRERYSTSPPRWEYRLTDSGRELFPLAVVAWTWERRWAPRGAGIPLRLRHRCGADLRAETVCAHCRGALSLRDVDYEPRPGVPARALPRMARARRRSSLTGATHRGSHDTLAHIADIVGDPWTPLVLAASFFGLRRFDEFQRELGIASNILATRLDLLVGQKVFRRKLYLRQPPRHEYLLTPKGRELFPYAVVIHAWGDRWLATPGASPFRFRHLSCDHEFDPVVRCAQCHRPVTLDSLQPAAATRRGKAVPTESVA